MRGKIHKTRIHRSSFVATRINPRKHNKSYLFTLSNAFLFPRVHESNSRFLVHKSSSQILVHNFLSQVKFTNSRSQFPFTSQVHNSRTPILSGRARTAPTTSREDIIFLDGVLFLDQTIEIVGRILARRRRLRLVNDERTQFARHILRRR